MILPHHLQRIIEVLSSSSILMIDLRPPADYEKSHIKGAINLRAPLSFIKEASFDMIERAFPDQRSRQVFGEWQSATCLVIYDRVIDASRDCPLADVLYDKFRTWGWPGRCFVLKGHYKEFSVSYKTSITGSKVSGEAGHQQQQQTPDPLRQEISAAAPSETDDAAARRAQYQELLTQIDDEGIVTNSSSSNNSSNYYASSSRPDPNNDDYDPSATSSGRGARATTSQHERDLEAEFRRRVPDLYRKALEVHGNSGSGGGRAAETPRDTSASAPAPGAASDDTGNGGGGGGTGIAETVTGTAAAAALAAAKSSEEAATGTATRWDGGSALRRGGDGGGGGNANDTTDGEEDRNSTTTFGFDTKAPLVEYLDRGLSHIRQGKPVTSAAGDSWRPIDVAPTSSSSSLSPSLTNTTNTAIGGMSKLAAEGCHAHFDSGAAVALATPLGSSDDSYVKISRGDAQYAGDLPAGLGNPPNPGHQHQQYHHHHHQNQNQHRGGLVGGKDGTTRDAHVVVGPSGDETPKRGRGGFLNKVLRRA